MNDECPTQELMISIFRMFPVDTRRTFKFLRRQFIHVTRFFCISLTLCVAKHTQANESLKPALDASVGRRKSKTKTCL